MNTHSTQAEESETANPVLQLMQVEVTFPSPQGRFAVVNRVDLTVNQGEVLGLVGESGCGKSMLARTIMGLVPAPGKFVGGKIHFDGVELEALSPEARRRIRGDSIAVVPQEPMSALNPTLKIGDQLTEVLRAHRPQLTSTERRARALAAMERVGVQFAGQRLGQYPHELSGGIRQRVMVAMALICDNVRLLIADEPTTALDVTIQAQILELFIRLQSEQNMAIILITHDLAVVAQTAHRVAVMYAGSIVELSPVTDLFDTPLHPYSRGLLASLPRRGASKPKSKLPTIPGTVPNLANAPAGCRFIDRCPFAETGVCDTELPALEQAGNGRWVRCFRWRELPEFAIAAGGVGT